MSSLRIRSAFPRENESLLGFMRRLGDMNHYPETYTFFRTLGYRYGRQLIENLEAVAGLVGVAADALIRIAPISNPTAAAADWRFERHHADPVCPVCVAEDGCHQQVWRHALVTACSTHEILLQNRCPKCSTERSPKNGSYKTCDCGFPLEKFPIEPASVWQLTTSRMIEGADIPDAVKVPPALRRNPPADVARFLAHLASSSRSSRTGKPGKTPLPRLPSETDAFLAPAEPLVLNWPTGFDQHVAERINTSSSEVETVKAKLGTWFTRLQEFEGATYKDFKDRVNIVATDLLFPPPAPEVDKAGAFLPVAFVASEDAEWITHDEAASLLGVSSKRLSVYIRQGNMPHRHALGANGRQVFAVPRQLILDLAAHGSRFATAKQAREYLGVHKTQFGHLLEAKVLAERDPATRPVLMHTSKFTWDDLAGLVRRIRSNAIAADDETVAFSELTLQRTTDRSAILSLLSSIGRAEISSVECSAELTLGQVRFLKTDIDAFLGQYQTSLTLSANEVAQLTGWKNECVAAWCSQGLLKSATVKAGGAPRYSIRNEHLVQFTNEYVPLATLAHHAGTTPRGLLRQLEAKGIRTSGSFPVADTTRGHLVRIVDLLPTAP